MYFLHKKGIFHCHVSLPEGRWWQLNYFFSFSPLLPGEDECKLTVAYFSDGLVQPPSRGGSYNFTWRRFNHHQDQQEFFFFKEILGGGFKQFFIFTPIPGEMMQFDSYFSDGLKPPTGIFLIFGDTGIAKQNMPLIEKTCQMKEESPFFSPAFSSEVSEM